jgi:antitoxin (DNA-binding transcriptional repressor) of toxin-antitoxin stability system
MQTVQVGEFKADLSHILEQVQQRGESFVIEFGKKHKKVAMLVPYTEEPQQRRFGLLSGEAIIPDDFDAADTQIEAMFYGESE